MARFVGHHLKKIYELFSKEQVHIVLYEDLKNNAAQVCKNIFKQLNIDTSFKPAVDVKHNVTNKTRSHLYARILRRFLRNENPIKKFLKLFIDQKPIFGNFSFFLRKF